MSATSSDPRSVLGVAAGASFIAFLDVTVVNVAFPDLRASYPGSSLATLSWVLSAYAVGFAALLTAAGRFADSIGRRQVYLASLAAFVVASVACAAAPSAEVLIAARALQGVAAAGLIPSALGLVLAATPPAHRMAAVGVWGAAAAAAAAAGPALGGVMVEAFGWRAVFVVNLPLGVALFLKARQRLAYDGSTGATARVDRVGTAMFAAGIALIVAGLTESSSLGWSDGRTDIALVAGVALATIALARSRVHAGPAIEVGLWRSRRFAVASAGMGAFGSVVFAWLLSGPLFLTAVWDYSVIEAGLAMSPGAIMSGVASVVVGRGASPAGQRAAVVAGALLLALCAAYLWYAVDAEPAFWGLWLPCNLLSGTALGMGLTGLQAASASALPPERFAAGTGLALTCRQVGGAIGVAVFAAILSQGAPDAETFATGFAVCGAASTLAALVGLRLIAQKDTPIEARPLEAVR